MANMFFSVGTNTSDLKVASNVTVSGTTATFTVAQTGNIGVGDVMVYDGAVAYICGKTSSTVWTVRSATGGTPTAKSDVAVTSIKRVFNTLNTAIDGSTSGINALLGTHDIVTATLKVFIACYADGDDTSLTTITNDWTTDSDYYIQIYAPINTSTECNQSQRHDGTYDGGGYTLSGNSGTTTHVITIDANYTKVFGLKFIRNSNNWLYGSCFHHSGGSSGGIGCEIAYNAMYQDSGGTYAGLIAWSCANVQGYALYLHDNFVASNSDTMDHGLEFSLNYQNAANQQTKIYNNTVYGKFVGSAIEIDLDNSLGSSYKPLVKNNYAYNSTANPDYTFSGPHYDNSEANFDYNSSDDGTAGTSNSNQTITVANVDFKDTTYATLDLHIGAGSSLVDQGIGPGSDSNVSSLDIDQDSRSGATCDIGADEVIASVGGSNTGIDIGISIAI